MEEFERFVADANAEIQRIRDFYTRVNDTERNITEALRVYTNAVTAYDELNAGSAVNLDTASEALANAINAFFELPVPVIDYGIVIRAKVERLKYHYNDQITQQLGDIQFEYQNLIGQIGTKYDEAVVFLRANKVMVDFRDIIRHPRGTRNAANIIRHRRVLKQLAEARNRSCPIVPTPDPRHIYAELAQITYNNTNVDSEMYRQIACDVMELLKQNTHSFMTAHFNIPVESKSIQLDLREHRVISDTSVEGVVWTVGYGGSPNPFATMKYSKRPEQIVGQPPTPKNHNMIHELTVGFVLNTIRNLTPNFMYTWAGFSCSIPNPTGVPIPGAAIVPGIGGTAGHEHDFDTLCANNTSETMEAIVLAEAIDVFTSFGGIVNRYVDPANVALDDADPDKIKWVDIVGIIFQIIAALSIAQDAFRFVHGDLHGGNVLIKRLDAPVNISYNLGGRDYFIPTRYIPIIIDYGLARVDYNNLILTPMIFMWDGQTIYPVGQTENDQIRLEVYMPLYDISKLLEPYMVNHQFRALDRVISNGLAPTILGLRNQYTAANPDPRVYNSLAPHPLRTMAINLYNSSRNPHGILQA